MTEDPAARGPAPDPWATGEPPNPSAAPSGPDPRAGLAAGSYDAYGNWYGYGYPQPPEPPRPWYRAPGSLIGAATFSAVAAWVTFAAALILREIFIALDGANAFAVLVLGIFIVMGLLNVMGIGLIAFGVTLASATAVIPLAVIWFRDRYRSTGAGLALVHAVIAWAAMAIAIVWLVTY